jgi:hypothetical protein
MNILMAQKEALPLGITEPSKIYNALAELTKAYGFSTPEKFWTEPPPGPLPPPPPDPKVDLEKAKLAHDVEKTKAELSLDQEKIGLERERLQVDRASKLADLELKRNIEAQKIEHDTRKHATDLIAREKPATTVQIDVKGQIQEAAEQISQMAQQVGQNQVAFAQQMASILSNLAGVMAADKELIRDPKTGKAIGTRVLPVPVAPLEASEPTEQMAEAVGRISEAMAAEREVVRDQAGKAKGSRVKRLQ